MNLVFADDNSRNPSDVAAVVEDVVVDAAVEDVGCADDAFVVAVVALDQNTSSDPVVVVVVAEWAREALRYCSEGPYARPSRASPSSSPSAGARLAAPAVKHRGTDGGFRLAAAYNC